MRNKIIDSYSLSQEALDKVVEIQKRHKNLKSKSAALEYIILNFMEETEKDRLRKMILEILKENQLTVTNTKPVEKNPSFENEMMDSIENIYKDMD